MKQMQFTTSLSPAQKVSVRDLEVAIGTGNLASITGNESLETVGNHLASVSGMESFAGNDNVRRSASYIQSRSAAEYAQQFENSMAGLSLNKELARFAGTEGFTLQNTRGEEKTMKAINLALNAQAQLQTEAAECLFRTITIPYEMEQLELTVRAAGLGSYTSGASAFQRASEMRPIFGLLTTGDIFNNDSLRVYPVFPEEATDPARAKFVPSAEYAPYDVTYSAGDAYGREAHRTSMLVVPVKVENILGLSQAPGQRDWTSTDQFESNGLSVDLVKVNASFNGNPIVFFVNTATMSNNAFGVTTTGQSSDVRHLSLSLKNLPASAILDKDGASASALFEPIHALGYQPLLSFTLNGAVNRQTNEFELSAGSVSITAVSSLSDPAGKPIPLAHINEAPVTAMVNTLFGSVTGARLRMNMDNVSQSNFGYRIEVYDALKKYNVRRREPVSVKYPVTDQDVNKTSLDDAIKHMSIAINNQCSKEAFDTAKSHLEYIKSIDGQGVVGNDQGANVLPGLHFVSATAVSRSLTIGDVISVTKNEDLFAAISAALVNEVCDIVAALETRSGIAAIKEYGAINDMDWNLVTHQNLARFFIRVSDARTIGGWSRVEVKATNFLDMVGHCYIVPQDKSTGDSINPLAGMGINVAKENIVVQGNMHRDQQVFGALVTVPSYKHHPLNPVIGHLAIPDAEKFITDEGLLSSLAKLRITAADKNGLLVQTTPVDPETDPNG